MQVSIPNHTHFKLLLCFIMMLMGYIDIHASKSYNLHTQKNATPINGSYPIENQNLYFEDVSLRKNDLNINSDDASIKDINSGKTVFTFSGNVKVTSEIVIIKCDQAILEFEENELINARFVGELSSFQQFDDKRELIASGTAEVFEYNHNSNILRMKTNAWVDNGSNEVSGNLITYNLVKRNIIADSENGSPVKLIIDSTSVN